jgi:hypothetical protein
MKTSETRIFVATIALLMSAVLAGPTSAQTSRTVALLGVHLQNDNEMY